MNPMRKVSIMTHSTCNRTWPILHVQDVSLCSLIQHTHNAHFTEDRMRGFKKSPLDLW